MASKGLGPSTLGLCPPQYTDAHLGLGRLYSKSLVVLLGRNPTALASLISWSLHSNRSFAFTASRSLSGPFVRDSQQLQASASLFCHPQSCIFCAFQTSSRTVLLIQPSTHANLRCDLARLDHSCISVCAPFEEQGTPLGYLPLRELTLSHQGYCLTRNRISFLGSMCCTGGFTRASLSLTALSQFTLNAPTP